MALAGLAKVQVAQFLVAPADGTSYFSNSISAFFDIINYLIGFALLVYLCPILLFKFSSPTLDVIS